MFRCGICGNKMKNEAKASHCCDEKKKPDKVFESELCPGLFVPCEGWLKDDAVRAVVYETKFNKIHSKYSSNDERLVFMAWYGYFKCQREMT